MRALALALLLTACGSVSNKLPDGGGDDDATPQPDARTTGTITVTVVTDNGDVDSGGTQLPLGLPRQGAQVFFIEASGDYTMATTGGDGVATSGDVHRNTTVVVLRPQTATQYGLEVFFALDPGMSITAGPKPYTYVSMSPLPGTMTMRSPPGTSFGITQWYLNVPCVYTSSSTGTPPVYTLTLGDPCVRTGRTAQAIGYDSTGILRAYSNQVGDLTAGADVTMPAFQSAPTFVANVANLPSAVSYMYMSGNYRERDDEYLGYFNFNGTPVGGALVLQQPTAPGGDRLEMDAYFNIEDGLGHPQNRYHHIVTGVPTSTALDGTKMLPFMTYPTWDAATGTISWDESGSTNRADLMTASGYYHLAAGDIYVNYNLYAPHVGSSFTLPALPQEIMQLAPTAADAGNSYQVLLIDAVEQPDYASVIPTADADSRNAAYNAFGDSTETWVSGGSID